MEYIREGDMAILMKCWYFFVFWFIKPFFRESGNGTPYLSNKQVNFLYVLFRKGRLRLPLLPGDLFLPGGLFLSLVSSKLKKWVLFLIVLHFHFILSSGYAQQNVIYNEYEIKTALLYKLAFFIDWPDDRFENEKSPIIVHILGDDPFGSSFEKTIGDNTVRGREIVLKRIQEIDRKDPCHILFISESEKERVDEILKQLQGAPILTVGDFEGFGEAGGCINFFQEKNTIRFEINVAAIKRAGLKIGSQVLELKLVRIILEDEISRTQS